MKGEFTEYLAKKDDSGRRLDRIIRKLFPEWSLSQVYKAIRHSIQINGKKAKESHRIEENDCIRIYNNNSQEFPDLDSSALDTEKAKPQISPEQKKIKLLAIEKLILFESKDILVLNKPFGMLVHGDDSLETIVLDYLKDKIEPSLSFKPGPLHRLDRNTSGIICFSKSLQGAVEFSRLLQERTFKKLYIAIIDGELKKTEQWIDSLLRLENEKRTIKSAKDGKKAQTICIPLTSQGAKTLALFHIETGLTHQIRIQSLLHGHPLCGDKKYESKSNVKKYFLHAITLKFPQNTACDFPEIIKAPLPEDFMKAIEVYFDSFNPSTITDTVLRYLNT